MSKYKTWSLHFVVIIRAIDVDEFVKEMTVPEDPFQSLPLDIELQARKENMTIHIKHSI